MSLLRSFGYAFTGIWHCINTQRNMRIHLVAAIFVLLFSLFFSLSAVAYAVLFLLIGLVLALELLNTALEAVGDAISKAYHPKVKILKDAAAGAVLVVAIAAVAIAVVLFWQPEGFVRLVAFYGAQPIWFLPTGLGVLAAIVWIWRGPKEWIRRISTKRNGTERN